MYTIGERNTHPLRTLQPNTNVSQNLSPSAFGNDLIYFLIKCPNIIAIMYTGC